ncbi:hypothetical protein TSAR_006310 [Trichomalopsis sarcophagae]|uniref:Uncharacterized protein n=1 Tax=Trichomalopsis sarcophagae TaxID=543379 RepID=A0A232FK24_9HYME|nr:hypothetical protein TSAR_006310 [Trichomalopsis sarcophagae]
MDRFIRSTRGRKFESTRQIGLGPRKESDIHI